MPLAQNLWQQALTSLELEIDPAVVSTWFRNTQLYETSEDKLIIACTDAYSKSIIQRKYAKQLEEIIRNLNKKKIGLEFVVKPSRVKSAISGPLFDQPAVSPVASNASVNNIAEFDRRPPTSMVVSTDVARVSNQSNQLLNPHLTLDNFVVGVSNRVVHAAAVSVVDNPGQTYNPLFIYGSTGVGKTHLLHAIGNAICEKHPHLNTQYSPAEHFVNDLIEHIRHKKPMEKFRKTYRTSDALLIDDIQFLTGKDASQEEFYHTFNELHQSGRQIVLASDREPSEIDRLADRLISRFKGGLMVQISSPDYETRLAIVRTKAEEFGLDLNLSMCQYIAEKSNYNVREIQGVLQQIRLFAGSQGNRISFDLVKSVLEPDAASAVPSKKITPELIMDLVKQRFDTSIKDLCGKRRTKEVVIPRQITMFLLRNELGMNLEDIGEILGGRDHTTVLYGCEKMKTEIESNDNNYLRSHLNAIRQELYA